MRSSMIRLTIARIAGSSRDVERADGRLDAVGEHDQGRLARLRLRAGVAERALVDGVAAAAPARLLRPGVEVAHDRRPVVLRDVGDQRLRQLRLVGQVDAVDDVLLEDPGADLRVELVVDVLAAGLVLDERERVRELADVVVVGGHAGHQRVGADRLGGALGEVADHQRVVVRARASRPAAAGAAAATGWPARAAGRRSGSRRPSRAPRTARPPRRPSRAAEARRGEPQLEDAAQVARAEQREDRDDQRVDDEHRDRRLEEDLEPVAAADRRRCRPARRGRCRSRSRASAVDGAADDRDERR